MSDMKVYEGEYSYDGVFKGIEEGQRIIEVRWFEIEKKYYKPSEPLRISLQNRLEECGWVSASYDEASVVIGGIDAEEALGNAFMAIADQYELIKFTDMALAESAQELKRKYQTWEVHDIGSQAQ